ncbi:hypothetical protein [Rhodanobacter lindaniclasticus]
MIPLATLLLLGVLPSALGSAILPPRGIAIFLLVVGAVLSVVFVAGPGAHACAPAGRLEGNPGEARAAGGGRGLNGAAMRAHRRRTGHGGASSRRPHVALNLYAV